MADREHAERTVLRPPEPRMGRATRAIAGVIGLLLLAGSAAALYAGDWPAGLTLFGLVLACGYAVWTGKDPVDDRIQNARMRCDCCNQPTLRLGAKEEEVITPACLLCEWEMAPNVGGGEEGGRLGYSLEEARSNFARHYRCYRPDDTKAWRGSGVSQEEIALKEELIEVYGALSEADDPVEYERLWKQVAAEEARLMKMRQSEAVGGAA